MAKIPTFLTASPVKSKMREKSGEILLLTDTSTFGKVPHSNGKKSLLTRTRVREKHPYLTGELGKKSENVDYI